MSNIIAKDNDTFFGIVYQRFRGVSKIILEDLSIITPQDHQGYSFFEYFESQFSKTELYNESRNMLMAHVDGNIIQLEKTIYDDATREFLNREGLDIYIYEVPLFYQGPASKQFYINLWIEDEGIVFDFPSTQECLEKLRCFEFDSIDKFIANNNLTNVTCYVLDYNNSKYCQQLYPKFKIYTRNFFLPSLVGPTTDSFGYNKAWTVYFDSALIKNKFISLAWRYTTYRQIVQTFLCSRSAACSWAFLSSIEDCQTYFDIKQWKESEPTIWNSLLSGDQFIKDHSPLVVDIEFNATDVARERHTVPNYEFTNMHNCPMGLDIPVTVYSQAFCAVVCESEFFRPTSVIGEKTFNAIKCGRPFILVAGPHSLEYLQKLGFKTFGEFWDESYDQIEDHEQRLLAILKLIDTIDKMSINELQELYNKMQPIIEHNFNHVNNIGTMQIVN